MNRMPMRSPRGTSFPVLPVLALLAVLASCGVRTEARRHSLAFGIADYPGELNDLRFTTDDMLAMNETFADNGYRTYMAGNAGATKTAIRTAVAALRDLPPEDTVVMYFSGHGYLDEADRIAYFIPYDGITEDGRFVRENWISPADMVSWFRELATDRIVLILDTCNSGAFSDPWNSIDLSPQQFTGTSFPVFPLAAFARFGELVRKLSAPRTGAPPIVIAASGADEESWESPSILYRHGIFTKYLLDSAYNGDRNGDGWVTATEAWHYAAKAILSRWNSGAWTDFMPHITGGARDIVLFSLR